MVKTGLYQPFAIKPFPTSYDVTASRAISRAIAAEPGLLPWWRTLQCTILNTNGKDSERSSAQPCISLTESLQSFPGHESIRLQLNLKNKVFPYFFLHFSLRSSLKRLKPSHYCYLSFSRFLFLAVRSDHLPQSVV